MRTKQIAKKRIVRNTMQRVLVVVMCLGMVSCDGWLDIKESNVIKLEDYWENKENVEAVLGGAYHAFRSESVINRLFVWGEARADLVDQADKIPNSIRQVMEGTLDSENEYAKWVEVYKPINFANLVLNHIDEVKEKDGTFTQEQFDQWKSEALFLRCLGWYQLTCTFGAIPLDVKGYESNAQDLFLPRTGREEVWKQIVADLILAIELGSESFEKGEEFHTRATTGAMRALLANVYLWQNDATNCLDQCQKIIGSGQYALLGTNYWFDIFYPGLSNEGIFELLFDGEIESTESRIGRFTANADYSNSNNYFAPSNYLISLYSANETSDVRGIKSTINSELSSFTKYTKTRNGNTRESRLEDANWIFYRMADVYAMRAEASIMQGAFKEAVADIDRLRARAGIDVINLNDLDAPLGDEPGDYYAKLLETKATEFAGEGKRWFDLQRIAARENYKYKSLLVETVLGRFPLAEKPAARVRYETPEFWLYPIHQNEIENNENVEQNAFYQ